MKTLSITISGKVQGVFYRQSTREKANALGLTGQVRNLPNGDVHILVTGTSGPLQELVNWCRKGPPKAQVDSVEVKDVTFQEFDRFHIIRL